MIAIGTHCHKEHEGRNPENNDSRRKVRHCDKNRRYSGIQSRSYNFTGIVDTIPLIGQNRGKDNNDCRFHEFGRLKPYAEQTNPAMGTVGSNAYCKSRKHSSKSKYVKKEIQLGKQVIIHKAGQD